MEGCDLKEVQFGLDMITLSSYALIKMSVSVT